ncbi:hypothetical protein CCHR01_16877 [Colletotrichum chrysophilum]|uniref:Uncharacterized protein n=1 Tax=Colletotrichum chrysophilum TaxID=1836956 RepID=A0AAD9A3M6_9PEZI|nr:hypothetical protein CCHR01_16877 [Colletotrichum chrysophilum]
MRAVQQHSRYPQRVAAAHANSSWYSEVHLQVFSFAYTQRQLHSASDEVLQDEARGRRVFLLHLWVGTEHLGRTLDSCQTLRQAASWASLKRLPIQC